MTSWRWGRLRPRGFLILGLGCELSLFVGVDLDAQSADVDGAAVAGADLVEHGLARDPELASGLVELEVSQRGRQGRTARGLGR
jgi:hypothetical protein